PVFRAGTSCAVCQPSWLQCTVVGAVAAIRNVFSAGITRHLLLKRHSQYTAALFSTRYRFTVCEDWSKIFPSFSDRTSLMYSECAHTSGHADPVGLPRNNSRCGISAWSQTCSGNNRLPFVEDSTAANNACAAARFPAASS